jgi:hypothetical protein
MLEDDLLPTEQTEANYTTNHSPRIQEALKRLLENEQEQKKRTFSYYDEIRKRDKTEFLSTKIQKQMERDAQDLEQAFYD